MALEELEDLLDAARRGGSVESSGQFTLDFKAAIAKLRGFQVENQYHYINRLIRTAALAASPQVEITAGASKTRLSFPVPACEPGQLEHLFEQIFQNSRPAARELATATNIALALQPSLLEIQVSDGDEARVLKIEGKKVGGEFKTEVELFRAQAGPAATTFQLTRSFGASIANWGVQSPEHLEVLRRFRYCPVAIIINGDRVNQKYWWGADPMGTYTATFSTETLVKLKPHFLSLARHYNSRHHVIELRIYHPDPALNCIGLGPSLAGALVTLGESHQPHGLEDEVFLTMGLSVDARRPSLANFIYCGETLQSFPARLTLPGVELLISAQDLNLDISGEKLAQDEAFQARWKLAKTCVDNLHHALSQAYNVHPKDFARRALFDKGGSWRQFFSMEMPSLG